MALLLRIMIKKRFAGNGSGFARGIEMGADTISPGEAVYYIGKKGVLFVDLREQEDYRVGHIPGAVWMDYDDLICRKQELRRYQMVILYCDRGNTSLLAARELRSLPIEIRSIAYGMSEYKGPLMPRRMK